MQHIDKLIKKALRIFLAGVYVWAGLFQLKPYETQQQADLFNRYTIYTVLEYCTGIFKQSMGETEWE
jgi:hypothetical protein